MVVMVPLLLLLPASVAALDLWWLHRLWRHPRWGWRPDWLRRQGGLGEEVQSSGTKTGVGAWAEVRQTPPRLGTAARRRQGSCGATVELVQVGMMGRVRTRHRQRRGWQGLGLGAGLCLAPGKGKEAVLGLRVWEAAAAGVVPRAAGQQPLLRRVVAAVALAAVAVTERTGRNGSEPGAWPRGTLYYAAVPGARDCVRDAVGYTTRRSRHASCSLLLLQTLHAVSVNGPLHSTQPTCFMVRYQPRARVCLVHVAAIVPLGTWHRLPATL